MKISRTHVLERAEDDTQPTIESLRREVVKLNDELTCASEAFQAISLENNLMKETLAIAARAFAAAGDVRMVNLMRGEAAEEKPKGSFALPASRRIAAS